MSKVEKVKKTRPFRSLTVTLSAVFLLLTLVILLITSGLETYLSFNTQQKAIAQEEQLIAQRVADAVKSFVQGKIGLLETAVKLNYTEPLSGMEPSLEKLLSIDPAFRQLVLFDVQQQEVSVVPAAAKTAAAQSIGFEKSKAFAKINNKEVYISPVYIDKATRRPLVAIAVPVENVSGDVQGALVAEVKLKFMWDLVSQLKIGTNGSAYVVDRQGRLIAFSDINRAMEGEKVAWLEKVSDFIRSRGMADQSPTVFLKGIWGTNVVSTYVPVSTPDWAAVVELPVVEAYAGVINQLEFTILIVILIIIFGAGLSIYLSRAITRPIISLRNAAEKITSGELNTRAEIKSKDEIGELAADFNNMVGEIQTRTRKLSEGLGRLQSLVESVKLGVIMVDLSLNIILSNSAAKTMLGKSVKKKIIFKDLSEKIKSGIDISQALSYYVHTGTPLNIQEVMIEDRYFRLFMSPVRDIIEKIFIGAVVVIEDITEQKMLDKMRTEIVSITSHQLRTPTTIVKGNLEILMNHDVGTLNSLQEEVLNDVYEGNQRMIRLINDLMDVAKIDEGRFNLIAEPAQLENVVAEVVKILSPIAKERNISLIYHLPTIPLPPVKINVSRVTQIIQNIIDNALKYSRGKGEGKVEIEIQEGSKVLELIVKDNGIGIPAAEQANIFERFSRGSNSTKLDPGGGSGLGLYIAKAVVEQGGGRIWFESKENEGTVFHTTYPYN